MNEIEIQENLEKNSVRKYWFCYIFHNFVVKKFFSLSSNRLQRRIIDLIIGEPKSILDTSCGDDDLIIKICRKFKTNVCVANDLSPKLTSFIDDRNVNVTYTNFNILSQPFVEKFDLVLCKNTFHHIPKHFQADLVEYLLQISNQLVIVDIEDPRNSSIRARIWNWYYRIFLGDRGDYFLNFNDFRTLLSVPKGKFILGKIQTIKGNYMYGIYRSNDFNSASNFR